MTENTRYLAFALGGETFAIDIRHIKEVLQYVGITRIPLMTPELRGVINLRGSVVPVVDLAARFHRKPTEMSRRTCIVILEIGGMVIGAMVDHVSEVLEIASDDIEAAPGFGSTLRHEFIQGIGKVGGKFVVILNASHVLSVDELSAVQSQSLL